MNRQTYPIVEVTWLDAEELGEVGWNNLKSQLRLGKKPPPEMKSVGYLVHDGRNHLSIISTMGPDICSTLEKIPKGMVISIRYLKGLSPAPEDG